jgi:hypothetical protein
MLMQFAAEHPAIIPAAAVTFGFMVIAAAASIAFAPPRENY